MLRTVLGSVPRVLFTASLLSTFPATTLLADSVLSAPLETVEVKARRIQEELEAKRVATPGAVTVVDSAELYQRNVTGLADMLRYVPGVWAESASGQDDLFISSRGSNLDSTDFDKNGVKLLQDGLPVTTADGNNHNRVIDPLSARYAIVARGANALTYGASTLGGAIDFISPTARTSAPVDVFVNGGSFGQMNGRLSAGLANDQLDGLLTLETKNLDGYRDHSSQRRKGAYVNAGWQISDSVATRVYGTYLDNDVQLPGTLTRAQLASDADQASAPALGGDYGKEVKARRIASKTTWQLDAKSSLEFGLSYETQSLFHPIVDRILVDFDGPGPQQPMEVFSLIVDTDHRDLGAMGRYSVKAGDHSLAAGVNFGDGSVRGGNFRNNGGERNGITEFVDNHASSLEAFAVDNWRFAPAWTLVYGGQYVAADREVRTTNAASSEVRNPQASYSSFNPRLGVIYALNEASEVFSSVSRTYEAPTTFELEDDARASNATLDAMKGTVLEAGIRGKRLLANGGEWRWDIAAYYGSLRDEILSVDDPDAPGDSLTTNIDRTIHAGIEALLGASWALDGSSARIEPLLSVTLNEFKFDSDSTYGDNRLPAAPRYALRGEVLYRNEAGFFVGPTFDFIGRRYADFSNTYRVGSYGLLGLRGGFNSSQWQIFAELRNVTNRTYVSTLSVRNIADADAAILNSGAPRAAFLGMRIQL